MTSVNYNASATTALRTLQATNSSLEATQNRISTGLKIGEAKDNAAYWAISTTLKSDTKSLATVKDALNLGAATVDVAYQGLNKTLEVLDEIKSKLTAATQDGVDKTKIQSEIAQLQDQLKSIASGSTFSGENWLNTDSSSAGYAATKQVVSSYTRDISGSVSIGTIDIKLDGIALIDNGGTAEGILEGGTTGNTATGGLANTGATLLAGTQGQKVGTTAAAITGTMAADDKFTLSYKIDGVAYTTSTLQLSAGGTTSADHITAMIAALSADADFSSRAEISKDAGGLLTIKSKTTGVSSTAEITGTAWTTAAGAAGPVATVSTFTTGTVTDGAAAKSTMATVFTGNALTLDSNDSFEFDINVDGKTSRVSVNKALVSQVLGTDDGKISSVGNFQLVLKEALRNANVTGVTVGNTSGAISFTGGDKTITVGNVNASKGTNLLTFDMSTASADQLTSYIRAVNGAAEAVTNAASTLGAVASRIDLQNTFVDTLIDTIDKGVSGLIDADLSEESTRLQALQTKQQLGIQALSIANSSTQNILSLFQN